MYMNEIRENALIESLVKGFPPSPLQHNRPHQADAELVHLPGTDALLAFTTDSVVEEVESGLYTDPYLIGWMTLFVPGRARAIVGSYTALLQLCDGLPPDLRSEFI